MHPIPTSLLAFTAAATLLTITPGLDTALVLRTAASDGPRRAAWSGLGIITGCFLWATLVALGLSALLVASEFAYNVLRWSGAVYLLYVGFKLLRQPRADLVPDPDCRHSPTDAVAAQTRGRAPARPVNGWDLHRVRRAPGDRVAARFAVSGALTVI